MGLVSIPTPPGWTSPLGKPSLFISVSGGFLHEAPTLSGAAMDPPTILPIHACLFPIRKCHGWPGNPGDWGQARPP